ncbi:MAG TPA: hypothetical protein VNM16_12835 [Bacillota bacterium]|nr:hypothetical protein [Bacillota bacterium]
MLRLRSRLYVEPGEIELLAEVASREGRRLQHAGGSSLPRGLMLEQLSAELAELLVDPHPPLYAIGPASHRQARMVARRLAEGARERAAAYGGDAARGSLIVIAAGRGPRAAVAHCRRHGPQCFDDGQERASRT